MNGNLITISAPSGAGKTSLLAALLASDISDVSISVSHTTRAIRPGETNGVDYNFIDTETFNTMSANGDFLEHAQVFDNFYGTSQSWVEEKLASGVDVILEIDWQGAQQVRQKIPHTQSIFILPPSAEALEKRLQGRGQDSEQIIARRMADAKAEMSHYADADFIVINDNFEIAKRDLIHIIKSLRLRQKSQAKRHEKLLHELLL